MAELSTNAKELIKRGDKAFEEKLPFDGLCQSIAENVYPERADFTTERTLGSEFATNLSDGTPVLMRRDLGNNIGGMLRPRGQPWFKHDVDDERIKDEPGAAKWLDYTTNIHRHALYASTTKFVRGTKEADHDMAAFGNLVLCCEENERRDGLRFRDYHLRDCSWLESADGDVDTLFRNFKPTARQMRQRWGEKNLHSTVQRCCEKEPDKTFNVRHIMMPAEDYEYETKKKVLGPKFVSIYIDTDNQWMISEAPSWEFRYIVGRWATLSGSQYAVSPAAMVSLPDARMLQALSNLIYEAGEKSILPPVKATEEAVRSEMNLFAGGITWVDRDYDERLGPAIEPIKLGENTGIGIDLLLRLTALLKDEWYISKLQLPQQGTKTAYETSQLIEEFIRANIPLFEPWESDYTLPMLEMSSSILMRVGAFGDPNDTPASLHRRPMTFSFSNPLQDAIEKNRVYQFQSTAQLFSMGYPIDPSIKRDLDVREGFREAVRGSGAPADWLVERKDADKAVAADKQAQQATQMAQQIGMAGQVAQDVGKGGQEIQAMRTAA